MRSQVTNIPCHDPDQLNAVLRLFSNVQIFFQSCYHAAVEYIETKMLIIGSVAISIAVFQVGRNNNNDLGFLGNLKTMSACI